MSSRPPIKPRVFVVGGAGAECACGWKLPNQVSVLVGVEGVEDDADLRSEELSVSLRCACGRTWTLYFGPRFPGIGVADAVSSGRVPA